MPEVVLGPARSANALFDSGDAQYVSAVTIDWDGDVLTFGRDNAKTPVNRGCVSHYDTSSVPIDSVVNEVKLEMMPSATSSGSFDPTVDVLAIDGRLNRTRETLHSGAQFIYLPQNAVFGSQVWADSRTSGSNNSVEMPLNIGGGVGSVGQVWTADTSGSTTNQVFPHYWFLQRTAAMSSTTIRTNVYNAQLNESGVYERGSLLGMGRWRDASLIATGSLTLIGMLSREPLPIVNGNVYVSELEFTGGSGAPIIKVGMLTSAGGSPDDLIVFARESPSPARYLQGFTGYSQWLTSSAIRTASVSGESETVTGFPGFTSGSKYGLGSSGYDPGTGASYWRTLAKFKQNIQDALNERSSTSDWLGVRLQDFAGTTNGRERKFYSSRSSTETITGYSGLILTIDYTAQPEKSPSSRRKSSPLVTSVPSAEEEYDQSSEGFFRRSLENSIIKITAVSSGASSLSTSPASMASKRERTLPKVGVVTIG